MSRGLPFYYAGVGSRKTPKSVMRIMYAAARRLALKGAILNSGAAEGADWAFEEGARRADGSMQIFLPFRGFRGHDSPLYEQADAAIALVYSIHPAPEQLTPTALKLHARNAHQVLGADLKTPVACLICWTPRGGHVGGTRTAIKLAEQSRIPVLNLGAEKNQRLTSAEVSDWAFSKYQKQNDRIQRPKYDQQW